MKIETLVLIEFTGRCLIGVTTSLVVVNMLGIIYGILAGILMILWILNPLFEYKLYGDE